MSSLHKKSVQFAPGTNFELDHVYHWKQYSPVCLAEKHSFLSDLGQE